MRLIQFVLVLLLLSKASAFAQSFGWNAGFDGFLDNREYYSINNAQTFFGSRAWGEIGADLREHHSFRVGLNYLYEFGHDTDAHLPDVTMYYQYGSKKILFLIGSFQRRDILEYPLAFLSDSLDYFQPNVQGIYASYTGNNWHQGIFIDWIRRKTDDRHEQFVFGLSGRLRHGVFFMENHIMMAHLSKNGIPDPDFHLRDNGGINVSLGLNFSRYCLFDTLVLKAGSLVSLDRIRELGSGWQAHVGFLGQVSARYRMLGIDVLYYSGEGHKFLFGDPFYILNNYGRLDLYVMPFMKDNINLKINFGTHLANGQLDYSQRLLLSIAIK
ncbi:MAG: hypothetical protein ACQERS_09045 [Bacteroidota bacterium]